VPGGRHADLTGKAVVFGDWGLQAECMHERSRRGELQDCSPGVKFPSGIFLFHADDGIISGMSGIKNGQTCGPG